MKNLTRKSFLKSLFGTTAAVAISSAIPIAASSDKKIIHENLFYRPYVKALGGYLAPMRGGRLVELMTSAFMSAKEKGRLEYQMKNIPQYSEMAFEVYTSEKMLPNEKIDRIEVTEDWLRNFCTHYGIC